MASRDLQGEDFRGLRCPADRGILSLCSCNVKEGLKHIMAPYGDFPLIAVRCQVYAFCARCTADCVGLKGCVKRLQASMMQALPKHPCCGTELQKHVVYIPAPVHISYLNGGINAALQKYDLKEGTPGHQQCAHGMKTWIRVQDGKGLPLEIQLALMRYVPLIYGQTLDGTLYSPTQHFTFSLAHEKVKKSHDFLFTDNVNVQVGAAIVGSDTINLVTPSASSDGQDKNKSIVNKEAPLARDTTNAVQMYYAQAKFYSPRWGLPNGSLSDAQYRALLMNGKDICMEAETKKTLMYYVMREAFKHYDNVGSFTPESRAYMYNSITALRPYVRFAEADFEWWLKRIGATSATHFLKLCKGMALCGKEAGRISDMYTPNPDAQALDKEHADGVIRVKESPATAVTCFTGNVMELPVKTEAEFLKAKSKRYDEPKAKLAEASKGAHVLRKNQLTNDEMQRAHTVVDHLIGMMDEESLVSYLMTVVDIEDVLPAKYPAKVKEAVKQDYFREKREAITCILKRATGSAQYDKFVDLITNEEVVMDGKKKRLVFNAGSMKQLGDGVIAGWMEHAVFAEGRYKMNSIKHQPRNVALQRIIDRCKEVNLQKLMFDDKKCNAKTSSSKFATASYGLAEGDGSNYDMTIGSDAHEMLHQRIYEHAHKMLGGIPLLIPIEVTMDLAKEIWDSKMKIVYETGRQIQNTRTDRNYLYFDDVFHMSGKRYTSVGNWFYNFVTWFTAISSNDGQGPPSTQISNLLKSHDPETGMWHIVQGQKRCGTGGAKVYFFAAFEGDDSLLALPFALRMSHAECFQRFGLQMKLYQITTGLAQFCGAEIPVVDGVTAGLHWPQLSRNLDNSQHSCQTPFDAKSAHTSLTEKAMRYCGKFNILAEWYLRNAATHEKPSVDQRDITFKSDYNSVAYWGDSEPLYAFEALCDADVAKQYVLDNYCSQSEEMYLNIVEDILPNLGFTEKYMSLSAGAALLGPGQAHAPVVDFNNFLEFFETQREAQSIKADTAAVDIMWTDLAMLVGEVGIQS